MLSESAGPEVIEGPGAGVVISGGNAVQVFQVDGGVTATLAGLTISGGSATLGGGIANGGTLTVTGCTIENNSATAGNGGGGGIYNGGTMTVTDCTIENNSASSYPYGGGGIFNVGPLSITDSDIADNSVPAFCNGGGIYSQYGTVTIIGSTIAGNSTGAYGDGGGIDNSAGTVTVNSSTVSDNSCGGNGGGIDNGGTLTGGYGGTLTIIDSTVANNSAPGGGGILNEGTLTAVNTTIAYNQTGYDGGAGVYDDPGSNATLDNTVVAVNTGRGVPDDIDGAGGSVVGQNDLVGVDATGSLTNGIDGNLVIGTANPGMGLLAYNGGPTQTIVLLAGSPAINAGSNVLANEYSLITDQRGPGFPRIVDGLVDIGAYERAAPTSTSLVSSPNPSVYGQTITLTATVTAGSSATVYTVNSTGSGSSGTGTSGTLPYVISQANLNPNLAGSVIQFAPTVFSASNPQTITLTSTLELGGPSGPMVIDGPGAAR